MSDSSTAAIILLQDFVELITLAILDELDNDETRNIESKSFDEILGELKKKKLPVVKSGTIKALNKQRALLIKSEREQYSVFDMRPLN